MSGQFTLAGKAGSCASGWGANTFAPVLRNTTGTRVCGIQLYNASDAIRPCCSGDVQTYWCNSYCATDMDPASFERCYLNSTQQRPAAGNATIADSPGAVYCQSGIAGSYAESVANASSSFAAPRAQAPSLRLLSVLLLAGLLLLATPSSASAVPPPASASAGAGDALARRADGDAAGCTFAVAQNYTTEGRERLVSDRLDGTNSPTVGVMVSVPDNNRTLNGSSAADARYDAFFGVVANATGRRFPATTGVELFFEWATNGETTFLQFIPVLFCVNGTASGCSGALGGSDDPQYAEACGPAFLSDWVPAGQDADTDGGDSDTPQGILNVVLSS